MNPEIARKFEANQETGTGISNDKLGMWIFLASEVIFFAVLIAGVFVLRLRPDNIVTWAAHKNAGTDPTLATINTFILIMSSVFVVSAIDAIQRGKERMMKLWLWLTLIGGCAFLYIQTLEWAELVHGLHEEFHFPADIVGGAQQSIFASGFYTLTGFHGTHVAIGVLLLIYVLIRAHRGDFTRRHYNALEMWGLYWHFVDLVWIILFTILYLL